MQLPITAAHSQSATVAVAAAIAAVAVDTPQVDTFDRAKSVETELAVVAAAAVGAVIPRVSD